VKNRWKIHGEAELPADPWARLVLTSQQAEGETETIANRVLTSHQTLQLASAESNVVRYAAIDLAPKSQPRVEVVHQRETSRVHMSARGLNSDHAGAGIAGE
jgi:hypothetical protein